MRGGGRKFADIRTHAHASNAPINTPKLDIVRDGGIPLLPHKINRVRVPAELICDLFTPVLPSCINGNLTRNTTSIMTANNLILLCLLVSVTSSAEISQIIREAAQTGAWLNKGLVYPRCSEPHFQRLHCSNFSLTQSPVAKDKLWQPDCDYLMRRIVCTLYTLACPSSGDSSFQVSVVHLRLQTENSR